MLVGNPNILDILRLEVDLSGHEADYNIWLDLSKDTR